MCVCVCVCVCVERERERVGQLTKKLPRARAAVQIARRCVMARHDGRYVDDANEPTTAYV